MLSPLPIQKRGLAAQAVARELMAFNKGDKVPTVTDLCEKLEISRGNVQYALKSLRDLGAVRLLPRGHLGTFLEDVNYVKLARICGVGSIVGVMPLPYSTQYEGLATALYSAINTGEIEGNIAFMPGSRNRLKLLLDGRYDFAVMSCLAYEQYASKGEPIVQVKDLGPGSFLTRHVVMVRSGFDGQWRGKKVGVDSSSMDQQLLSLAYFKDKQVEFVPLIYSQIMPFLMDGTIDAVVWNSNGVGLNTEDISMLELDNQEIGIKNTQASIVCRADDTVSVRLLDELLDCRKILAEQRRVVQKEMIPRY